MEQKLDKTISNPPIPGFAEPSARPQIEREIWTRTVKEYFDTPGGKSASDAKSIPGFISIITSRRKIEFAWLYRLLHKNDPEYGFCVNLADVQRMYLRLLQGRLTWLALSAGFDADCGFSQGVVEELGPTLRDYVQALRDHDYMGQFSGQRHDPFKVSDQREQDRWILEELMGRKCKDVFDFPHLQRRAKATGPWERAKDKMRPIGGTRGQLVRRAVWSRALGAFVGAAFLIGPMWLLVLQRNIYLQLGVTTGCMLAFGSVMVMALNTLEAVFVATLAYAAVLMVFVGVVMQSLG